jgi:hypothetical protein
VNILEGASSDPLALGSAGQDLHHTRQAGEQQQKQQQQVANRPITAPNVSTSPLCLSPWSIFHCQISE